MKNSIITYLLSFFFLVSCFKAVSGTPNLILNSAFLEIDGKITNANEGDDGTCLVELICANEIISVATLKDGKKTFKFMLQKNMVYTIKVSKRGYLSRLVCIDTKLSGVTEEDLYSFSFETKLVTESASEKLNKEFLDFPVALIYFDTRKDCFVYDKDYTLKVKKEITSTEVAGTSN